MKRLLLLVALIISALFAACGSPGSPAGLPVQSERSAAVATANSLPGPTPAAQPSAPPAAPTPAATATMSASPTAPTGGATATVAGPSATATGAAPTGTAASTGFPLTYTDAAGQQVSLETQPRRIVSLFPVNNETLFAIGAGDQIIAVDDFTAEPAAAAGKPKVGGNNFKFDTEKIVALKPDLVITSAGTQDVLDKPLRAAGVKVVVTPYPSSVATVARLMRDLGTLTGHAPEAERYAAELESAAREIASRAAAAPRPKVYYETDASTPGKPYTVGNGSLINELITIAGGSNVFATVNNPFPQVSYESIVKANPDVIVLGDAKGYVGPLFQNPVTPQQVKGRPGFAGVTAVRTNRVVPIHAPLFEVPGPRLAAGLRELAGVLHPELYPTR